LAEAQAQLGEKQDYRASCAPSSKSSSPWATPAYRPRSDTSAWSRTWPTRPATTWGWRWSY